MNKHISTIVSTLIALEEGRDALLAVGIAAALPIVPDASVNPAEFYFSRCFSKTENLVTEVNEHVMIEFRDVVEEVKTCWLARMHAIHNPLVAYEIDNAWTKELPEFDKEQCAMAGDIAKEANRYFG